MVLRAHSRWARILLASALIGAPSSAVTIDWVLVGDPGNAADTTGFGAVAYAYRISATEITNVQYAEFLNAVAATDTNDLYDTSMGSGVGGITRTGSPGTYSYSAIAGRENMPVNYVSFWDSLRFVNWLQNGQPAGAQDDTTTEDGAYTITALGIANNSITRNPGATIFLTSEDEWYKAAFYDAVSASYFDYPAGTDTQTVCAAPGAADNTANCDVAVGDLTVVGSYAGAASPYGTFDQGGNVWEWTETILSDTFREVRSGAYNTFPEFLASSPPVLGFGSPSAFGSLNLGFRVAAVPEPSTALHLMIGLLGLAVRGASAAG